MPRTVFGMNARTSNTNPSGIPQGTLGGVKTAGGRPGMRIQAGDEVYLWLLVLLEILAMAGLRNKFRSHHGG